jgi:peptidoglycan/LPS O-acetylase OafA/YrhL
MSGLRESAWDSRGNNFDFMRLALAVLVILSHSYLLIQGSEAREPAMLFSHQQVTIGGIAVDSFFIMSGFLITASALRSRTAFEYLRKRVSRIYPAFIVAAVFALVVVAPLAATQFTYASPLARLGDFIQNTLRLRAFSYTAAFANNPNPNIINGSLWSVQYEFWCYLGVLLLAVTSLLKRRRWIAGIFVCAWLVSIPYAIYGWTRWPLGGRILGPLFGWPPGWARMLPLYLAGVTFYLYREKIPQKNWLGMASLALLIIACWMKLGFTLLFPIAGAYLLFWFAFTPKIRLHRFGRFGDFSYGTYLYAYPIEQLLVKYAHHPLLPLVLFVGATPLTLACAVASWYGVERRFLRPARRKETIVHGIETPVGTKPLIRSR